jgi:hypothetical protein
MVMQSSATIFIIGVKEIALSLGLGVNEVSRLVKTPNFPARKYGCKWVSTREELEKWAKEFMEKGKDNCCNNN